MKKHFGITFLLLFWGGWSIISAQDNPADKCGIIFASNYQQKTGLSWMQYGSSNVQQFFETNTIVEDGQIGSVSPSPNGDLLAVNIYHIYHKSGWKSSDLNAIFLVDVSNMNVSKLVDNARSPVWSPDGKKLAYLSDDFNSHDIYVYDFETQMTAIFHRDIEGYTQTNFVFIEDWSPDSTQLLLSVIVYEPIMVYTLFILDTLDLSLERVLAKDENALYSAWGQKDNEIYYAGGSCGSIRRLDLLTSTSEEIFRFTNLESPDGTCWSTQIDVNNKGDVILSGLSTTGYNALGQRSDDIYLFDQKTQVVTNLTQTDNAWEENPQWWCSPYLAEGD